MNKRGEPTLNNSEYLGLHLWLAKTHVIKFPRTCFELPFFLAFDVSSFWAGESGSGGICYAGLAQNSCRKPAPPWTSKSTMKPGKHSIDNGCHQNRWYSTQYHLRVQECSMQVYMGVVQNYGSPKLPVRRAFANLSCTSRIGAGNYDHVFLVHI